MSVEMLGRWYREVLLLYKRHQAIFPTELESHYRHLTIRWSSVREQVLLARSNSDSSIEETLATGQLITDFDTTRLIGWLVCALLAS